MDMLIHGNEEEMFEVMRIYIERVIKLLKFFNKIFKKLINRMVVLLIIFPKLKMIYMIRGMII
jgi:hypothetical protein